VKTDIEIVLDVVLYFVLGFFVFFLPVPRFPCFLLPVPGFPLYNMSYLIYYFIVSKTIL
jgi:hypothetical protein